MLGDRSDIARGIKAHHLQVPIGEALSFAPDEPATSARERLAQANYDHAPVLEAGHVVGIVRRDALDALDVQTVGDASHAVGSELLVSADATVASLLGWLATSPFLFVLDGRDITGFVAPGDLNKQPGRTYFFLLLAELEIGLAEVVRRLFAAAPAQPLELLTPSRRGKVLEQFAKAAAADREPDYVAYFNLTDLLRVARRSSDMHRLLDIPSGEQWERMTGAFVGVRNAVVHGVRDLVDAERGPADLQGIDQRLHAALDATSKGLQRLGLRHEARSSRALSPIASDVALAGVDGCRAGWVAALQQPGGSVRLVLVESAAQLLDLDAYLVAIDMPIGLPHPGEGGRSADRAARARLGPRRSSVFSAPAREALVIDSWEHPDRASFGLTLQAMGILPKIRALDAIVTPDRQWRGEAPLSPAVAEVHPEVTFAELNGGDPVAEPKRTRLGQAQRLDLLRQHFSNVDQLVANRPAGVAIDDALDALAALWTARRIVTGSAIRLGHGVDARGLEMVIWA